MPVFIAKHNEYNLKDPFDFEDELPLNMLGTIRLPQNMKLVNLPKSNYDSDEEMEEETMTSRKKGLSRQASSEKNLKSMSNPL